VLLKINELNLVIDSGPDFRQQMLQAGLQSIHGIVFTHEHMDHIAGLDDVRAFNYTMRRHVPIFGTEQVIDRLKRNFDYAFDQTNRYPGVPEITPHVIDEQPFEIQGVRIVPLPVWHYRMRVLGFRVGNLAYITDANRIDDATYALMNGVKVLVINALRRESHISHFNLEEALAVSQKVGAEATYLVHMSHQLEPHHTLQSELPTGVFLSWDGLEVEVD
jgi:phosphoribosyl 1,2-cyclic phosphate phosphodiesterase